MDTYVIGDRTLAVANAIAVQEIFDPSSPGTAIGAVTADGTVLVVPGSR